MHVGEQREKCFGPCSPLRPDACPAGISKSSPPEAGHCSEEKGRLALAFLGSNVMHGLHFLRVAFFPSCQVATKALNIGRWGPSLAGDCKTFCRSTLRMQVPLTLLSQVIWLSRGIVQLHSALLMRSMRAPSS